ncbi:hypothetical protein SDC9_119586 [bioreactor metagenome]|uniref:Uncharacterized protein n=1 Tax=bioreactor metagenome TaxID=1076179 RepID=A0A645C4B2_9ZZZZ
MYISAVNGSAVGIKFPVGAVAWGYVIHMAVKEDIFTAAASLDHTDNVAGFVGVYLVKIEFFHFVNQETGKIAFLSRFARNPDQT